MSGLRRLAHHVRANWPWTLYQRMGLSNLFTDMVLRPVVLEDGPRCRLTRQEYDQLIALPELARFRAHPFAFDKVLEYAASIRLLEVGPDTVLLDAAGGHGEYAAAVKRHRKPKTVYCLDAAYAPARDSGVVGLSGDVSAIPLPDESVDAVSCHHSFEHFKGDADIGFLKEAIRVLRPGGRLCVVPLFLCNAYAEIRNVRGAERYDAKARQVYDPLGTFPGWGKCERFARVYDQDAFETRLAPVWEGRLKGGLHSVLFEGEPCPDLRRNRHQPRLNGHMKALVLQKI